MPPAHAQDTQASSAQPRASAPEDSAQTNLPVSLDRIERGPAAAAGAVAALASTRRRRSGCRFSERQKIEELLATLFLKTTPGPFGGYVRGAAALWIRAAAADVSSWTVDNPLRQPYAAFSGGELLTILIENLVGKYLGGRALNAVSNAERARAKPLPRKRSASAVAQHCAAQPNGGAGVQICGTTVR